MTLRLYRTLIVMSALLVLLVGVSSAAAQDDDFRALLASLPQGRTADGGFVIGDPAAPITIVEFADYACPHCQDYHEIVATFIEEYVATGKARFEFRVFPTAGGRRTIYASRVAECAGRLQPGGYWQANEVLYEAALVGLYNAPLGRMVADELGIEYLAMLGCIWRAQQIVTDYQFATAVGVNGTPAVMVRYGDGEATFIEYEGTVFNRGPVPFAVLAAVVDASID